MSLALRVWNLDGIDRLVFDEVYYVKYAVAYLTQQPIFDAHPPLGKYLIALGIALGEVLWFPATTVRVAVEGLAETVELSPLSFRWLNAWIGSAIPILVAGVALELSGRRRLAFLAGLFASLDGFLLVESRFALLHVYLVTFGLLGQWCFLKAWRSPTRRFKPTDSQGSDTSGSFDNSGSSGSASSSEVWTWLLNAGFSLGAAISVKWNGLGYWLVPAGLWLFGRERQRSEGQSRWRSRQRRWLGGLLCLCLVPSLFYGLLWLPHLRFQTDVGFLTVHQQILGFHQGMDDEAGAAHPYCSPWWSWPLMLRPIAYFFEKSPADSGSPAWRSAVQAMGNPVLWWLTTGAIAMLLLAWGWTWGRRWLWQLEGGPAEAGMDAGEGLAPRERQGSLLLNRRDRQIATYLLLNYAANWLPWVVVKRCTFTYHHLGALCFGMMALAFWCDRGLQSGRNGNDSNAGSWAAKATVGAIVLTVLAFLFWLPIYLGLPLSELGLKLRFWLPTWT